MFHFLVYALATIGGVVVLAVVALAIAYVIMSRGIQRKMRSTVSEMELAVSGALAEKQLAVVGPAVIPPMRIHLEPMPNEIGAMGAIGQRVGAWLTEHGFDFAGNFLIEELLGEQLQVYVSRDRRMVGALRCPNGCDEPYMEFCFDLGDAQRGGVSNPPDATLQLPAEAVGRFHRGRLSESFELLSQMWLEASELIDEHHVQPVELGEVPAFFEDAHAAEMDCRIANGGVSELEIREALIAQGIEPDTTDVEEIQEQWQVAIELHLLDFSSRAMNHYASGSDVLIVYDGSVGSYLMNRLRDRLDDFEDLDPQREISREDVLESLGELRVLLSRFSPREAIARFRPLLPLALRYDLIDQLKHPVEADFYLLRASPPFIQD